MTGRQGMLMRSAFIGAWAVLTALGLWGCGGGGMTPPPSESVTISGKITFDRLVFGDVPGSGLRPDQPLVLPARQIVVEAVDAASRAVLASGRTDDAGDYALNVPAQRSLFIRAKAQMVQEGSAPTWHFAVRNNTNADALYALDGSAASSGTANSTRNLHAASGWGGTRYTSTRAAAPFAILDTARTAMALILSAAPDTAFPALNLFWHPTNRDVVDEFCPDTGSIRTSFYVGEGLTDDCEQPDELPTGIYVLGGFNEGAGDTDEFDPHVIAHEFGHYYEDRFSRSDSIGGSHAPGHLLDLRVAFGEGWGNAFAGMVLNDPLYRDSFSGVMQDSGFDLEAGFPATKGWFSEMSVGEILWDIFDDDTEPGDVVALGFAPIHEVMTGPQVDTDALTSIYSFATALMSANAASSAGIRSLLARENIVGTDAFGADETNSAGDPLLLPIYQDIRLNQPLADVCSRSTWGSEDGNKLGNNRFLVFENDITRAVTILASGAATSSAVGVAATDPDIFIYRQGRVVASGESSVAGSETISQASIDPGIHVIEVYDWNLSGTGAPARCMTVSISGQ